MSERDSQPGSPAAQGGGEPRRPVARSIASPGPPSCARRGNGPVGQWPLQSFLELGAYPSAVPCARLHARQLMWEWELAGLSDDIEILVSELLTNAVNASQSLGQLLPVRLWLLSDRASVLILVWDGDPRPPVRVDAGGESEGGRGLLLVETISDRWDWYVPQDTGGKAVWALVARP